MCECFPLASEEGEVVCNTHHRCPSAYPANMKGKEGFVTLPLYNRKIIIMCCCVWGVTQHSWWEQITQKLDCCDTFHCSGTRGIHNPSRNVNSWMLLVDLLQQDSWRSLCKLSTQIAYKILNIIRLRLIAIRVPVKTCLSNWLTNL